MFFNPVRFHLPLRRTLLLLSLCLVGEFPAHANTLSVSSLADAGPGSLRQAILDAAAGDTITISATGTLSLTSGQLTITKDLTIAGPGAASLTISGNDISRVFEVLNSVTSTIQDLTISHGHIDPYYAGGGIFNSGRLSLRDCTVSNNFAYVGGGLYNRGSIGIHHCTVSGNVANYSGYGGGIYNASGPLTVYDSSIINNTGGFRGGGISNLDGAVTLTNSIVSGNSANVGGGIDNYAIDPASLTTLNSSIINNSANFGSGIYNFLGLLNIRDTRICGNTAAYSGGGIVTIGGGGSTLTRCILSGNTAKMDGGGLSIRYGGLSLSDCTLTGNTAGSLGGGVRSGFACTLTFTRCTISGNTALISGGGLYGGKDYEQREGEVLDDGIDHDDTGSITISACTITNNSAPRGGGIDNHAKIYLKNALVAQNPSGGNYDESPITLDGEIGPLTIGGGMHQVAGNNLSDDATLPAVTQVTSAQLRLGPLADNGGPTQTHALLPGSVAIDAAADGSDWFGNPLTTDQRGLPRLAGSAFDIGAFEYQNLAPMAHDDIVTAVKNTALVISVLVNDTDPENDPLAIQSTTPASHGQVTINNDGTITYKPTSGYLGADTFTYTITDGHGGTSTATVYVNVALQTSVLVTNASCVGTGSVALYARLVQGTTAGKNNLIAGQPLLFLVNGVAVGTGITDAYGKAYVNYLPVAAGSFPITVQFTGSGTYAPSEGTGTLTVTPSATEITIQPTGGQAGGGTTITGRLARTSTNKGLMGVSVTVSVDGTVVGTVTTGTDGVFTCPYSIPAGATSGAHNITASFAGNALNSPSIGSATLTVAP